MYPKLRILGSMHIFPKATELPKWAWDAFEWCEALYFEAPQVSDPEHMQEYGRAFNLEGDPIIKELVSAGLGKKINAVHQYEGEAHFQSLAQLSPSDQDMAIRVVLQRSPQFAGSPLADDKIVVPATSFLEFRVETCPGRH
jgi:uncharacterized protein YbaP (TraB family)